MLTLLLFFSLIVNKYSFKFAVEAGFILPDMGGSLFRKRRRPGERH